MPKKVQSFKLTREADKQSVPMPRRARIVSGWAAGTMFQLYAEVEFDESTEAFDTGQHRRHFVVVWASKQGAVLPENGGLVAADQGWHVYEVRG